MDASLPRRIALSRKRAPFLSASPRRGRGKRSFPAGKRTGEFTRVNPPVVLPVGDRRMGAIGRVLPRSRPFPGRSAPSSPNREVSAGFPPGGIRFALFIIPVPRGNAIGISPKDPPPLCGPSTRGFRRSPGRPQAARPAIPHGAPLFPYPVLRLSCASQNRRFVSFTKFCVP